MKTHLRNVASILKNVINNNPLLLLILALSVVARVWIIFFYQHPLDTLFSDPARHWENGIHFLTPGPMGAADPFLYQLWIFIVHSISNDNWYIIGAATAALSALVPYSWYLAAREIIGSHVRALQAAILISWTPSSIFLYSVFGNESLLVPLLGFGYWSAFRSRRLGTTSSFALACAFLVGAGLTRSIVFPVNLLLLGFVWLRQKNRIKSLILGALVSFALLYPAAQHSLPHFGTRSPLGNFGKLVLLYFLSGAKSYQVLVNYDYVYIFESPSYSISPFEPFYQFETIREGTYKFVLDSELQGRDLKFLTHELWSQNWQKIPRLVGENLIFLFFGHYWPGSSGETWIGLFCLRERWVWFPLVILALIYIYEAMRRKDYHPMPIICSSFLLFLICAQVAPMEGRYRKPLEPILIVTIFWALERRRLARTAPQNKP